MGYLNGGWEILLMQVERMVICRKLPSCLLGQTFYKAPLLKLAFLLRLLRRKGMKPRWVADGKEYIY